MATKQSEKAPTVREYAVKATVTISIGKRVRASSAEEARDMAEALTMPGLCHVCESAGEDDPESWVIGGLDGEPSDIEVEE